MTCQHAEDVEVQRVSGVPRAGARHVLTRCAHQRTDGGVLVITPFTGAEGCQQGGSSRRRCG